MAGSTAPAADWLILIRALGGHGAPLVALLERFGGPAALRSAEAARLRAAGLSNAAIAALQAPRCHEIEADLDWLARPGHGLVTWGSEDYPPLLATLVDPPLALFVRGAPEVLGLPQLAMVGSRNPTPTGRETATRFARHLVGCGLTITSGLALGIDAASHHGAMAGGGLTLAVYGTGPDIDYPANHRQLADQILERGGAIVTELPPGTPPRREHFPQRNRIISGLSLGTLVVEATRRSGSLITARLAGEQGREVFAIPGSIHNPLARGCHQLIRQGAKLVESAEDIFEELQALAAGLRPAAAPTPRAAASAQPELDDDYRILLEALGSENASVDELVGRSGLTAEQVSSMLLILELRGSVESAPGGRYCRTREAAG